MGKQKFDDYYVGLDLGTNSVGWAVTDKNYKVLRFNHKSMWGIRLFDEAKKAEERRMARTSRRRLQRQKDRLAFLEQAFKGQLNAIDPKFLTNLKNSRLYPEDKVGTTDKHPLFNDDTYTDKEFYEEFPTIYHLRYALMHRDSKPDLRFIYLSLHEMMKHRGHFLYKGKFSTASSFQNIIKELNDNYRLSFDLPLFITEKDYDAFKQILRNPELDKKTRKKALYPLLAYAEEDKNNFGQNVVNLLVSGNIKANELFQTFEEEGENTINLSIEDFENKITDEPRYTGVQKALLFSIKKLYDWALLSNIMQGQTEISSAMIQVYETHKEQLALLKKIFKNDPFLKEKYAEFFHDGNGGYGAYIGNETPTKRRKKTKDTPWSKFFGPLKVLLNSTKTTATEEIKKVTDLIDKDAFLIKPKSNKNGVIPHQLHEIEFRKIMENAERWYPFLKEKDATGLSLSEKLVQIFNFKIPYYIGPLNDSHPVEEGGHAWVVRKKCGKVYPWNLEEKIDIEKTATRFIRNMTAKCTYLPSEDVLPKNSMHYQSFEVLNEINNLRLDGRELPISVKEEMIEDLYRQQSGNVTKKKIEHWLYDHNYWEGTSKADITGVDTILHGRLTSYHCFKDILGLPLPKEEILENIIFWLTCFPDEPKMIASKIREVYPNQFDEKQIQKIASKHMVGWGRLSDVFLTGIQSEELRRQTGEGLTVLEALKETNMNLMQLLSTAGGFSHAIEQFNAKNVALPEKMKDAALQALPVSPAVKRPIWQAYQILEEITSITGRQPKRIFVEIAREKQPNAGRTESRKEQLKKLYKNLDDYQNFISDQDLLHLKGMINTKEESEFRRKKLYLYLLQMGHSMYTKNPIPLDSLFDNDKYDIDHIYPKSLTGDGALHNLVLVEKTLNSDKSDKVINPKIQEEMKDFWKYLKSKNLISEEKYTRLCRTTPLKAEEKADFVGRQLVETRQSTKALTKVLKKYFPQSQIVYVKAGHVSQFRSQQKDMIKYKNKDEIIRNENYRRYIKVRMMNDLHHAKDAYLNIVVGNVYFTKFTNNPLNFIRKADSMTPKQRKENKSTGTYNLVHMFDYDVFRIINKDHGNTEKDVAWHAGPEGSIQMVDRMMAKHDILSTRLPLDGKGSLFNIQPVPKGKNLVSLKKGLASDKYGGYNSSVTGYFFIVSGKKKGKSVLTIEAIPLLKASEIKTKEDLIVYCEKNLAIDTPIILYSHMHCLNELIKYNGIRYRVRGRSNDQIRLKAEDQPLFDEKTVELWKKLEKAKKADDALKSNTDTQDSFTDGLEDAELNELYKILIQKSTLNIYKERLLKFHDLSTKAYKEFDELSKEEKVFTLIEILNLLRTLGKGRNLSKIGGSTEMGECKKTKNIKNVDTFSIILQSVTGLFEQEVKIK